MLFEQLSRKQLNGVVTMRDSSSSIKEDFMELIAHNSVDLVVIGETAYTASPDPDSWISSALSSVVNTFSSPLPQYLYRNANVELVLVSSDGTVQQRPPLTS